MDHFRHLTYVGFVVVAAIGLCSCPPAAGPDPAGEGSLSDVFAHVDEEMLTYRDVAPPVMPELAVELDDPGLDGVRTDDMVLAFANLEQFLASEAEHRVLPVLPDGAAGSVRAAVRPRSVPDPTCFDMGPGTFFCVYQWPEGDGTYTLRDLHMPEAWQISIYFKGDYGGVTYPGDMDRSTDWGYLLQDHLFEADATSGEVQFMMEPGVCSDCDFKPWVLYTFAVEDAGTIVTPWGEDDLITYIYSTTMWTCWPDMIDPRDRYHPAMMQVLTAEPNGDVTIEQHDYDLE